MGILKSFEKKVLDELLADAIPPAALNEIKENGVKIVSEITGHGWGDKNIPQDFRNKDVEIEIT